MSIFDISTHLIKWILALVLVWCDVMLVEGDCEVWMLTPLNQSQARVKVWNTAAVTNRCSPRCENEAYLTNKDSLQTDEFVFIFPKISLLDILMASFYWLFAQSCILNRHYSLVLCWLFPSQCLLIKQSSLFMSNP